jgi:two-component system, NtrC family, response regulator PilR
LPRHAENRNAVDRMEEIPKEADVISTLGRTKSMRISRESSASIAGGFERYDASGKYASRVIICDEDESSWQKLSTIIEAAGAYPVSIEEISNSHLVKCWPECCVAVVVTGPGLGGAGMQEIRDLKAKGFNVIACAEGIGSWPIKTKCLPLLAGAIQLLDSSNADFPCELRRLIEGILNAEARKRNEDREVADVMHSIGMVGVSSNMMRVFRSVVRFSALSDLPVLITGETGTGKEGLARAVHLLDAKRAKGPFVAVNCGAINAGLAESEFFGHRRGAFTGAERERKGLVRSAEGGVLFLDEIADLEVALQTKLLRVLQENRVLGVGDDHEVAVSVRVVAASNRDLEQMIQQKKFRPDLFHRLNVLTIRVPPLRQRPNDLEPLVKHFLEKYRSLAPLGTHTVDSDFLEALSQIELPGNVRQLENLVREALVCKATESPLHLGDLSVEVLRQLGEPSESPVAQGGETTDVLNSKTLTKSLVSILEANDWNLRRSLEKCERQALEAAMERTRGNRSETARLLGITTRSVYTKVHKYGLKSLRGGASDQGMQRQ